MSLTHHELVTLVSDGPENWVLTFFIASELLSLLCLNLSHIPEKELHEPLIQETEWNATC